MPNDDQTEHFGDRTKWDSWNPGEDNGVRGFSDQGWALPQDPSRYISFSDPYWGRVRDNARAVYGDPNIHYDTDDLTKPRHLVFGDGTRLPEDGRVVYHNTDSKQDWAQNKDGTASLVNPDGSLASPTKPTSYRQQGNQYAPLDEHGRQVGPLVNGAPNSANGFYTDPKTGALTPKNSNGDYYTAGPDGTKSYFDKSGAPITESRYTGISDQHPPTPGDADTDEQQTGQGAAAVKKMQDELKGKYTKISDADERFAEALLTAHATTADGRNQLNDIQKQIIAAIDDPANELDTPAGERSFLSFLREQAAEAGRLMNSGALTAADQSKVAQATAALYAADSDTTGPANPDQPPAPAAPTPAPAPNPSAPDPGVLDPSDPGLGPAPQMPNPGLDPGTGPDPFSELGSALPGALGGLGGLGSGLSSPLDGLSGLGGLGSGLGDLGGGGGHDHSDDGGDSHGHGDETTKPPANPTTPPATTPPGTTPPGTGQPDPANGTPGTPGQPPAPIAAPAAASPTVTLPDGSSGTARTAQVAASVRDYLAGTPVDAAYRQNGLQLPPPGTPITNPVDTSALTCGDIAMFKDHYEPVLSAVKGYHNGQVVPLSSVTSSPDFMGFFNPAAASAAPSAQTAGAAVPAPPPSLPGSEAPNPVPVPAGG